jgi:hypothetical protein
MVINNFPYRYHRTEVRYKEGKKAKKCVKNIDIEIIDKMIIIKLVIKN